ncbi:MAG: peptide deformylase [Planctomycetota bacterium]
MKRQDLSRLKIIHYPDPVLLASASPVRKIDDGVKALAARMLQLMHEAKGVGLAAPQVGRSVRLFVCNPTEEPQGDAVYVNPRFVELSGGELREEGCLSLPGVNVAMRRAMRAVMEALDLDGQPVRVEATELLARVWQHEADHLDGRLIIDSMSPADEIANRRIIKQLKDDYKPPRRRK